MNTDWQNLMAPAAWILHGGAFVLGACIGSFLNVVIWRVPRGESLSHPPSHCPKCGHPIRPWENIPILAWIFLRGRCSACRNPISMRYPLVELLTALVFLGLWLRVWQGMYPLSAVPTLAVVAGIVLVCAFTDWDLRLIPNKVTYTGLSAAVLLAVALPSGRMLDAPMDGPNAGSRTLIAPVLYDWMSLTAHPRLAAVIDVAVSASLALLITLFIRELGRRCFRKKLEQINPSSPPDALGLGDVKLLVAIAALLGFESFVFILLLASATGFVFGIVRQLIPGGSGRPPMVPFGPFIAVGVLAWLLAGPAIQAAIGFVTF